MIVIRLHLFCCDWVQLWLQFGHDNDLAVARPWCCDNDLVVIWPQCDDDLVAMRSRWCGYDLVVILLKFSRDSAMSWLGSGCGQCDAERKWQILYVLNYYVFVYALVRYHCKILKVPAVTNKVVADASWRGKSAMAKRREGEMSSHVFDVTFIINILKFWSWMKIIVIKKKSSIMKHIEYWKLK